MVTHKSAVEPPVLDPSMSDIEQLATLLDAQFRIPGTSLRFGYDSIIGLVPGVGDSVTALLGGYIVYRARQLGAPPSLIARMLLNLGVDAAFGSIPIVGDVFDFAFKANRKNVALLRQHLAKRASSATRPAWDRRSPPPVSRRRR